MPAVTTINPSGDSYTNGLLGEYKWAADSFSYSFPTDGSHYGASYGEGENVTNFGALNTLQQATVRTALSLYSSVADLTFSEIAETATDHADLRFALSDAPRTAWAYYPSTEAEGGDAWFNQSRGSYSNPVKGNYAHLTFLHEIGHALGLEHPHTNGMPSDRDSLEYTVMSYRSYPGASTTWGYVNETWGYAQSLMMVDIAALQHMYGANYGTNGSNTVYSWSAATGEMFIDGIGQSAPGGNRILLTVWDGGGTDTYDFSNYGTNLKVDLRPGGWTTTATAQLAKLRFDGGRLAAGNIANALLHNGDLRSLIENAVGGSGSDTITGNQAANALTGNAGNDKLTGAQGDDLLDGGSGSDMAVFGGQRSDYGVTLLADGSLQVQDLRTGASDGTDIVRNTEVYQFSDRVYTAAELTAVEEPVTPEPPATDDPSVTEEPPVVQDLVLTGTSAADNLYGAAGNDRIDGRAGNDALYGLEGNDVLVGGSGRDVLDGGAGTDTASYATATAGVVADLMAASKNTRDAYRDSYVGIENLTGSRHADFLRGNDAANALLGGAGSDALYGRGGSDWLEGGDGADYLEGGSSADTLYGQGGKDILYGGGGADMLAGGANGDLFLFKAAGDTGPAAGDTIQDFTSGVDRIDLRGIDANTRLSGNQAFSFIGSTAFTGKAGQLNFSGGILSGDVNGDKAADFQIGLLGVASMKTTDFYL
ncbi:M10 family metallopeptidase C-terminal domain-containing protein [Microvirga sp. CF3016]|uniref:M10 family metallopeptidase C-terminal domain-containing protein n=1 Tax=Microvirga sp. CF3016 TaxID=3110181 RepID=UPI002E79180E|nr:M10 family metallopeptidase C-terminal domain-containing protein [Microvirga sp. CF3016]MEE1609759.1 M10 family metallopeptidase C-terminal domain-containing protein [Microvirga sp. CF3016]